MVVDYKSQDDDRDSSADNVMRDCLEQSAPKSFFLFAGAGSGKTKSLIDALNYLSKKYGEQFLSQKRNIAVITYTNAACDEIKRRAQYNPLFVISTIHSFAWELIRPYTTDLKEWLRNDLYMRISDLEGKQVSGRQQSQAYRDRERKIANYKKRLENLLMVKKFIYSPDGINNEKNSLDHSEVLKICACFLTSKRTFQDIFIDRYPILLIDESQDTKKELMEAFIKLASTYNDRFSLGLLGDTMQRIYLDGKEKLQNSVPDDWEKPCKIMNHRSRKRIVDLCNDIRQSADGMKQESRQDKTGGIVRIFIIDRKHERQDIEMKIRKNMLHITNDLYWDDIEKVKCLTVEHQMAAKRLGFENFFEPIYSVFKQGATDGSLSVISIFLRILLPLYQAYTIGNRFEIARIIRKNAIIYKNGIHEKSLSKKDLEQVNYSINSLLNLWDDNDPKCIQLLRVVSEFNIFDLPNDLKILLQRESGDEVETDQDSDVRKLNALALALEAPFSEVVKYQQYVSGSASFDTHQGVKGLEFERVMVVIDDEASQGSTFNYNKLFGITPLSD
ncbi:UvrD-helicase domain-containing protein, partial [Anaerospora hongkongensis]|uniref:UvrD-helicase domain-containing protein n=1 Tax=Anaerospora hongkongensis TaxID=244830 RepID=UPI002FD8C9B0